MNQSLEANLSDMTTSTPTLPTTASLPSTRTFCFLFSLSSCLILTRARSIPSQKTRVLQSELLAMDEVLPGWLERDSSQRKKNESL